MAKSFFKIGPVEFVRVSWIFLIEFYIELNLFFKLRYIVPYQHHAFQLF